MTPVSNQGIKDNYFYETAGAYLQRQILPGASLSIVTAYFSIYAYAALKTQLDTIRDLRFLFGEPRFLTSLDPARQETKHFTIENSGLALSNVLQQKTIARDCAHWIQTKAQVRSLRRSNLLHGKMYLVSEPSDQETMGLDTDGGDDGARSPVSLRGALLGSSNFTVRGLGLGRVGNNIELNLVVGRDNESQAGALHEWFDRAWSDASLTEDVKAQVLQYLAQLYANQTPEFVYYKTLFHVFDRFLADSQRGGFEDDTRKLTETAIWNVLFDFQKDGVKGAINKINRHGGCILADSVGLGKTYEALAVIKYFELKNQRVLVLCPKKLSENWTVYQAHVNSSLNPLLADRFGYTVLHHTDLTRTSGKSRDIDLATFHWDAYDLVVIDESHNFRTESRGKDGAKSRYEFLMESVLQAGARTRVLLLSATPVNNDLKDLRAQIRLIAQGDDTAFRERGIGNLESVLTAAQGQFNRWALQRKSNAPGDMSTLLDGLSSAFFTLLDELTIARSRRHIERYYPETLERIGKFPRREKPVSIFPEIDLKGGFPDYDTLNQRIAGYSLALFKPTAYLKPEFADAYTDEKVKNFSQTKREGYLVGMMKVNFLKRLESSVHSFATTLERTIARIDSVLTLLQNAHPSRTVDPMTLASDDPESDEDDMASLAVGSLRIPLKHLRVDDWRTELIQDRSKLQQLADNARAVTEARDAKLAQLKALIAQKSSAPNRKVLVFTAFADTAAYLYDALHDWAKSTLQIESALIVGSGQNRATFGRADFQEILTHFSPRSKQRSRVASLRQDAEIDLVIATDCISEGQNLQDADLVVNYDIHWNPVRLIQRFGRIDRLGSTNESIRMVNFWPTAHLDQYINVKSRVEARMALVDIAATGYDGLLDPHDIEEVIESDLNYRDKQLLRLKDEVLDLEEMSESVTLSEFTLDDFRRDLARFIEANRAKLEDAPPGLYACVPASPNPMSIAAPGVLFCLRQKDIAASRAGESVNPTAPYFLVYVRDDKTVRLNFTHAKQALDLMRDLCLGKDAAYESLCDAFDRMTNNGSDMKARSEQLDLAVAGILNAFQKRETSALFASRGAQIARASEKARDADDFELITWLVLLPDTAPIDHSP